MPTPRRCSTGFASTPVVSADGLAHGFRMRRAARGLIVTALLLVAAIPITAGLTIALLPAWARLEARWGIESVGHSGPASWCYAVVYAGCIVVAGTAVLCRRRRPRSPMV
jgi:hypothetical protein